ncbi:Putative glutamine amidotransferase [Rickettsiales bacterium Ac37b]|nr:Putative glutamine amidotransferase [Rickettsiales bacterium Ac37b]
MINLWRKNKNRTKDDNIIITKPVIGITIDSEEQGWYSEFPWYEVRQNYCTAISNNGGVPLLLPYEMGLLEEYIGMMDGLMITGGNFDISPEYYEEKGVLEKSKINKNRTDFEMEITKLALKNNIPILGICGGEQLINVILDGTLIKHIPEIVDAINHEQTVPKNHPWHMINIEPNSLLHRITGVLEMSVNSTHHQAVKDLGRGVIINATALDGIIEAIEYSYNCFCLGVQWHPEYEINEYDTKIFKAFIDAALQYARRKNLKTNS